MMLSKTSRHILSKKQPKRTENEVRNDDVTWLHNAVWASAKKSLSLSIEPIYYEIKFIVDIARISFSQQERRTI